VKGCVELLVRGRLELLVRGRLESLEEGQLDGQNYLSAKQKRFDVLNVKSMDERCQVVDGLGAHRSGLYVPARTGAGMVER